ncbi:hypothetical protein KC571_02890 [candidate division WWE3 bacterium]|uniref:Cytochrome b5 heme-binding domain-containing protein n=1 Tax=candidate division WWE3 bacterium TaxID=2053526 RepID=A0A955LH72_UNCKA|nr:hypothetical protein [candidate division WWE3 bacterium]
MLKKFLAATLIVYFLGTATIIAAGLIMGEPSSSQSGINNLQELILLAQQNNNSQMQSLENGQISPTPSPEKNAGTNSPQVTEGMPTPSEAISLNATPENSQSISTPTATPQPNIVPTQPQNNSGNPAVPTATPIPPTPIPTPTTPALACGSGGSCTSAQVSQHNSRSDCWVIVASKVYNVTAYVNRHPGGSAAFDSTTCGHNIDLYMQGVLTTSGLGKKKSHSQSAYNDLNAYYIANLTG